MFPSSTLTARNTTMPCLEFQWSGDCEWRQCSNGAPIAVSPGSISNFVGGVWTGQITVSQPTPGMYLRADDRDSVIGNSATFAVSPLNDLVLTITDTPDPVVLGNNLTYTISLTNTGPTAPATWSLPPCAPNASLFGQGVYGTARIRSHSAIDLNVPQGTARFTVFVRPRSRQP